MEKMTLKELEELLQDSLLVLEDDDTSDADKDIVREYITSLEKEIADRKKEEKPAPKVAKVEKKKPTPKKSTGKKKAAPKKTEKPKEEPKKPTPKKSTGKKKAAPKKTEKPKEEPKKVEKLEPKDIDYKAMKVGDKVEDKFGSVVKKTSEKNYLLQYHREPKNVVAFDLEGDKWNVDCCEQKGIQYIVDEINIAIRSIIEGLDCQYFLSDRKKKAEERKKKQESAPKVSEGKKLKDRMIAISVKTESMAHKGDKISKESALDIVKTIKAIIFNLQTIVSEETLKLIVKELES